MCTAISFRGQNHYFGRNLDLEYHYDECVTVVPRNLPLGFRHNVTLQNHYAIIGIGIISNGYPLLYEAVNEHGLSIAALNFPQDAQYQPVKAAFTNIASFELIPWVLAQARDITTARKLLQKVNVTDESYSESKASTPLHWMIADQHCSIVVEPLESGLQIYENPTHVLTNSPAFDAQLFQISQYSNLTNLQPVSGLSEVLQKKPYSRGLGAVGMPGDLSSMSRFVRASFTNHFALSYDHEVQNINQFFHLLDSVYQVEGCNKADKGQIKTVYSSCYNTSKGICYFTTYYNRQIRAVDMHKENLSGQELATFPLTKGSAVSFLN